MVNPDFEQPSGVEGSAAPSGYIYTSVSLNLNGANYQNTTSSTFTGSGSNSCKVQVNIGSDGIPQVAVAVGWVEQ